MRGATLGDVVDVQVGFACGKEDESGVFQFRMHNVTKDSSLSLHKRRRVPSDAHKHMERFWVRPGDVLFNATNSPGYVGKSVLVPELNEPAVFSNHFIRLRSDPRILDSRYLWRWLQFAYQRGTFVPFTRQWVNQATVGRVDLLGLEIDLPEMAAQRRIAAILDHADALRAKRRQGLAHLDDLILSTFHEMFDGLKPSVMFEDVADVQGGLQVSRKRDDYPEVVPYLRVANVHRGRLDLQEVKSLRALPQEIERTRLEVGDLLFVEGHANPMEVGRVAVWSGEVEGCVHQNHLIRGRVDATKLLPTFAAAWLNTDAGAEHFRRAGRTTSGLNTISAKTVKAAPVVLPPMSEQGKFDAAISAVAGQADSVRKALMGDDELFASLQSRAFRGEL